MMDVVAFAQHVYRVLRQREEDIKEVLAADGLPNWEEYKKLVGELRGLSLRG
jgi:preprotein translocase subunit Sss1